MGIELSRAAFDGEKLPSKHAIMGKGKSISSAEVCEQLRCLSKIQISPAVLVSTLPL